jgi:transcriptional regulator with XRE-family HTH domain
MGGWIGMAKGASTAGLALVSDDGPGGDLAERGRKLKERRLRLGIKSHHELVRKMRETGHKIDRAAISKVERGVGTLATIERLEVWFDRFEEETGEDDYEVAATEQIEVTFRNVFGIGEIIYKGSPENFPEIETYIERMVQREREQRSDQ